MSAAAAAVAEPVVGHPRKVVVVVQLELDEHLLALAVVQLANRDVHVLSVRGDDRIRPAGAPADSEPVCVDNLHVQLYVHEPVDMSPPRQSARQSHRSYEGVCARGVVRDEPERRGVVRAAVAKEWIGTLMKAQAQKRRKEAHDNSLTWQPPPAQAPSPSV